ncbi:hypothetical protein CCP3SC1AL1_110049 [Gammaproteobacteria bacterium]
MPGGEKTNRGPGNILTTLFGGLWASKNDKIQEITKMAPKKEQVKPSAVGFIQMNASTFSLAKPTLTLTVDEDTDMVSAEVGNCVGAAYLEYEFGYATGVYGTSFRSQKATELFESAEEEVFARVRAIGADGAISAWSDEESISLGVNDILAYSFAEQTGAAVINDVAHTVAIEVAFGTVLTALVATFTLSPGATAKVGATAQVSGTTENNFTSPVVYAVKSQGGGGSTQNWTVTVTVAAE